jgi:hypothetical protein
VPSEEAAGRAAVWEAPSPVAALSAVTPSLTSGACPAPPSPAPGAEQGCVGSAAEPGGDGELEREICE